MQENKRNKDIELRSEKVRNIVGKIPPFLLRMGMLIISAVIVLLLGLAYFIPYPEYKDITVSLYSDTPVQTKKSPATGLFQAKFDGHRNKGEQTGILNNDTVIPIYTDISGCVYYQVDGISIVKKGDILFTTVPDTISEIYGICSIPYNEIGRIKKGQEVNIKIEDREEAFQIKGQVSKIYSIIELDTVTDKTFYKVEISGFPDSLRTIKDKYYLFPNEKYNGKILLSNQSILKKILRIK